MPGLRSRVSVGGALRRADGDDTRRAPAGAIACAARGGVARLSRAPAAARAAARDHVGRVDRPTPAPAPGSRRPAPDLGPFAGPAARPPGRRHARRVAVHGLRHGRVAPRHPPFGGAGHGRHRSARGPTTRDGRVLRRVTPPRGSRRRGPNPCATRHRLHAGRRARRRRQRGLRRGDEGIRHAPRHAPGPGVQRTRRRFLGVAVTPSRAPTARRRADPSSSKIRVTCATYRRSTARYARSSRPRTTCSRPPTTDCAAAPAARTPSPNGSCPNGFWRARPKRCAPRPGTPVPSSRLRIPVAWCNFAAPASTPAIPRI